MGNQKKASVQEVIQHTAVGKTYKVDAPLHSMTDSMTVLVPAVIDADSNEGEDELTMWLMDGWMGQVDHTLLNNKIQVAVV